MATTIYRKDNGKPVIFAHIIDAKESVQNGFYTWECEVKQPKEEIVPVVKEEKEIVIPKKIEPVVEEKVELLTEKIVDEVKEEIEPKPEKKIPVKASPRIIRK